MRPHIRQTHAGRRARQRVLRVGLNDGRIPPDRRHDVVRGEKRAIRAHKDRPPLLDAAGGLQVAGGERRARLGAAGRPGETRLHERRRSADIRKNGRPAHRLGLVRDRLFQRTPQKRVRVRQGGRFLRQRLHGLGRGFGRRGRTHAEPPVGAAAGQEKEQKDEDEAPGMRPGRLLGEIIRHVHLTRHLSRRLRRRRRLPGRSGRRRQNCAFRVDGKRDAADRAGERASEQVVRQFERRAAMGAMNLIRHGSSSLSVSLVDSGRALLRVRTGPLGETRMVPHDAAPATSASPVTSRALTISPYSG